MSFTHIDIVSNDDREGETMSSEKNSKNEVKDRQLDLSKNFLIPAILLHLRDISTHGYELMQKMTTFGIESIDKGNFYRVLRQLEKDNIVISKWDTTSTGPAKRIYSLTKSGEKYLELWASTLSHHQKMLHQFFNLYNPFISPFNTTSNEIDSTEEK